jgi:hypothetical protein
MCALEIFNHGYVEEEALPEVGLHAHYVVKVHNSVSVLSVWEVMSDMGRWIARHKFFTKTSAQNTWEKWSLTWYIKRCLYTISITISHSRYVTFVLFSELNSSRSFLLCSFQRSLLARNFQGEKKLNVNDRMRRLTKGFLEGEGSGVWTRGRAPNGRRCNSINGQRRQSSFLVSRVKLAT